MIAFGSHPEGTVVPVLAQPGAKRNAILGERGGALRVAVTSPPEKGKANAAIIQVLAGALGCRPSSIALLSGETSRQKRFLLTGLSIQEIQQKLSVLFPEDRASQPSSEQTND
jgi:uncharacterized protein (TIGR00251 family)